MPKPSEFEAFAKSPYRLEIRSGDKVIFRSKKNRIIALREFIKKYGRRKKNLIIFDKVVGSAAALLFAYLRAKEVYGVLGSRSAKKTLRKYKIKFYFHKTNPIILNQNKTDLCPMEKLSKNKTPEEFYNCLEK